MKSGQQPTPEPLAAADPKPLEQVNRPCELEAYVSVVDPYSAPVRAEANESSKLLGRLPSADCEETILTVVDIRPPWVQISASKGIYEGCDEGDYIGGGWIPVNAVGIDLQPEQNPEGPAPIYERAELGSKRVGKLRSTSFALLDCKGDWVKIRKKKRVGWLSPRDICGLPMTTCIRLEGEGDGQQQE